MYVMERDSTSCYLLWVTACLTKGSEQSSLCCVCCSGYSFATSVPQPMSPCPHLLLLLLSFLAGHSQPTHHHASPRPSQQLCFLRFLLLLFLPSSTWLLNAPVLGPRCCWARACRARPCSDWWRGCKTASPCRCVRSSEYICQMGVHHRTLHVCYLKPGSYDIASVFVHSNVMERL